MKNKIITTAIILSIACCSSIAYAVTGHDGNGGDGIKIDNKIYLFDLVESGLHLVPYFDTNLEIDPNIQQRVNNALYPLSAQVNEKIAKKLTEIYRVDQVFSTVLLQTIEAYSWHVVKDFSLIEINDEDGSDIVIPKKDFVQAAVRSFRSIKISGDVLEAMDNANIAALIFHEIIYAISPLTMVPGRNSKIKNIYQSPRRAREITSYLFSPQLRNKGFRGLRSIVASQKPNFYEYRGLGKFFSMPIPVSQYPNTIVKESSIEGGRLTFFWELSIYPDYLSRLGSKIHIHTFSPLDIEKFNVAKEKYCDRNLNYEHSLRLLEISIAFKFNSYTGMNGNTYWFLEPQWSEHYSLHKNFLGAPSNSEVKECRSIYNEAWDFYVN